MNNRMSPTVSEAHRALLDNLKYIGLHLIIMFFAAIILETTPDVPANDFQGGESMVFFDLDILDYIKSTLLSTISILITRSLIIKLISPAEITTRDSALLQTPGKEWLRIFLYSLLISLISGIMALLIFFVVLLLFTIIGIGSFAILPEFGGFGVMVGLFILLFVLIIYFSIMISLIEPMLAFDVQGKLSLGQVIMRSIGIAHRNFGQLFKMTLISIGLILVGGLLFLVGLIYTVPLVMIYTHLNYIDIFNRESAQFN
ncbi:hypothetical protein HZY88_03215 [Aerococcaceae bacterium DSM 111176]|nr:hypothetical protein [Aerococcaceae bacterium DSM 111176]